MTQEDISGTNHLLCELFDTPAMTSIDGFKVENPRVSLSLNLFHHDVVSHFDGKFIFSSLSCNTKQYFPHICPFGKVLPIPKPRSSFLHLQQMFNNLRFYKNDVFCLFHIKSFAFL